jgi:ectoine hydroxylase-related dioxygenase (phytanoyl-CoA dioxygenase family)
MPRLLTVDQVEQFRETGCVFPIRVLNQEEVRRFRAAYEEYERRRGGRFDREGREWPSGWLSAPHRHSRWAYDLATHPWVLDAIEDLLGPDILLMDSKLFPKLPHSSSFVAWHQDGTYSSLAPKSDTLTAWIALSESRRENSCMRVLLRSDRLGQRPHVKTADETNLLRHGQMIEDPIDEASAVDVELAAGEMSVHNPFVIHGSGPNRSDSKRVGLSVNFGTPRVAPAPGGERKPALLVRGSDAYRHFEPFEIPAAVGATG